MDIEEWTQPTVDPEVRAYVYSLVSAIGGTSVEEHGRYILGDDALACLKDLRRWVKLYDQRLNRLDVARCLAEANLVKGDLLEILAWWPEEATEDKLKSKIALACLELLVPLTWPIEIEDEKMTINHHRHVPYVQLAQVEYKRAILHHDIAKILRTVIRIGLPSMAQPRNEPSTRDEGIIRLVLYFFRNIAMIEQPPNLPSDGEEAEISRSVAIDAFHYQDVFQLLLTVSSSVSEEFASQDVVILEILFYLLKGIDPEKLFMEEQRLAKANTDELRDIIRQEKSMLNTYTRHAPTRHTRFGTMIWVKRDDERVSTVVGQDILGRTQKAILKMDQSKKWHKPRHRGARTEEPVRHEFDKAIPLTDTARKHLRAFVGEFLDSSFNPLFNHLRKTIEREAERVLKAHSMQYFYLVSWFLEAERARHNLRKHRAASQGTPPTDASFALVASVLNQETFILLNRFMQRSQDDKSWLDLNAAMKCFTQILHSVQNMTESPIEDDQEIAENIQNRIFYEESTHDRIISILRNYKNQGFGYLDACTELAHVFLRMLERYSKQNVDLQVRSKRRARKKRKAAARGEGNAGEDNAGEDEGQGSEGEDIAEAQRTTSERKFDFARFSARFMTQPCVDTFVAFTKYYIDLKPEQLKRAHRFFYRVAFKMELSVILFRVDVLHLFNTMITGPQGLDPDLPAFKEWEELVRQIFRRAIKKVQERPELVVEMLFSKIPATLFYLEHGYERELPTRAPRPPAELEVKPGMERSEQIGVAVSILINQNKTDALAWIKNTLSTAASERQSWLDADAARKAQEQNAESLDNDQYDAAESEQPKAPSIFVKPDNDERRVAVFKDNKLRLLMTLLGFQRVGVDDEPDSPWIIPSSLSPSQLNEGLELVKRFEFDPPTYEDGKTAEDFIRSKAAARRTRAAYDDDSEGGGDRSGDEGEFLFPAGGPTARRSDVLEELKTKRRRRNKVADELTDEEKARRAEARQQADLERRRKIKSDVYIRDSDDETDEERDREFFEKEAQRRVIAGREILKAIRENKPAMTAEKKRKLLGKSKKGNKRMKRATKVPEDSDGSDDSGLNEALHVSSRSASPSIDPEDTLEHDSDSDEGTDTPLSSQPLGSTRDRDKGEQSKVSGTLAGLPGSRMDIDMRDMNEDDKDDMPVRKAERRAVRAGFVVESDSE